MRFSWQRVVNSKYVRYLTLFVAPFMAKPSDFSNKRVHYVYGLTKTMPFVPLAPAYVCSVAQTSILKRVAENFDWPGMSVRDVLHREQLMISISWWTSYLGIFIFIYLASGVRWFWHYGMKKFTDAIRRDGMHSGDAPWYFFLFHTSGLAMWMGLFVIGFAAVLGVDSKTPFETVQSYLNSHMIVWFSFAAVVFVAMNLLSWNSKRMKSEIYVTRSINVVVTASSFLVWIFLFSLDIILARAGLAK